MLHRYFPGLVCLIFLFSPLGCGEKIEPGSAKQPSKVVSGIRVATVDLSDRPHLYEAVGTVEAGMVVELDARHLQAKAAFEQANAMVR